MKIDLRKLYGIKHLDIDETLIIKKEIYTKMGVKDILDVKVKGSLEVNYENNIEVNLEVSGIFIIPCAVTLEDVNVPFSTYIEEEILENTLNNDFFLDLFDILWENIVLEIPLRVVKEGVKLESQKGNGWEMNIEDKE